MPNLTGLFSPKHVIGTPLQTGLDKFLDKKKGTCIVIGNGPSLAYQPKELIQAYPTFAMNYFSYYSEILWGDPVDPDWWVGQDTIVMEDNLPLIRKVIKFPHMRLKSWCDKNIDPQDLKKAHFWQGDDAWYGFGWHDLYGVYFSTTLHAACYIAYMMGFTKILWVGADCTVAANPQYTELGKGVAPHFYDPDLDVKKATGWNMQAGTLHKILGDRGVEVVNISARTMCDTVPWENWRKYAPK